MFSTPPKAPHPFLGPHQASLGLTWASLGPHLGGAFKGRFFHVPTQVTKRASICQDVYRDSPTKLLKRANQISTGICPSMSPQKYPVHQDTYRDLLSKLLKRATQITPSIWLQPHPCEPLPKIAATGVAPRLHQAHIWNLRTPYRAAGQRCKKTGFQLL